MTISYSGKTYTLLLMWKGSLYKVVWHEILVYLIMYFAISFIYRFALPNDHRRTFEKTARLFRENIDDIPVTFLLGFYVSLIVRRWWEQFVFVAWPDDLLGYICILIPGREPEQVRKRRLMARWLNLTACLAWRDISLSVRRRFPTMDHIAAAGLITPTEMKLRDDVTSPALKWSLPLIWCTRLMLSDLKSMQLGGRPPMLAHFFRELNVYRNNFKALYCYDWVCLPLVYTQVAALATYGYFAICLVGRQYLATDEIDIYFPVFTVLQFAFYVGWYKVGIYLMRPFELEDDDLELNYMLDRHIQTSYAFVDQVASMDLPPDDDIDPILSCANEAKIHAMPYTRMAARRTQHPPRLLAQVRYKDETDAEVVEKSLNEQKRAKYGVREF